MLDIISGAGGIFTIIVIVLLGLTVALLILGAIVWVFFAIFKALCSIVAETVVDAAKEIMDHKAALQNGMIDPVIKAEE